MSGWPLRILLSLGACSIFVDLYVIATDWQTLASVHFGPHFFQQLGF